MRQDSPHVARLLDACRVPNSVEVGQFGLWRIDRQEVRLELPGGEFSRPYANTTVLRIVCVERLHLSDPYTVLMDDGGRELRRHLPILLYAKGRVLLTGLGLGCVLRGLLSKPGVEHVDCIEIDGDILDRIGPEFADNPRVTLHLGDALQFEPDGMRWDFAWHDVWGEDPDTQVLHAQLLRRYRDKAEHQGAWMFPREVRRLYSGLVLDGRAP